MEIGLTTYDYTCLWLIIIESLTLGSLWAPFAFSEINLFNFIIISLFYFSYVKRTSKEKDSSSRLASHFAKAMPGWESKIWHSKTNKTKSKAIPVHRNVGIFFSLKISHLLLKNKQDFSWLIKIFPDWSWRNMMKTSLWRN